MQKEVLIHVRGLQMMDAQGDQEPIEIVVAGQYYFRNGSHYLRYEELLDETAEPTINYIKMSEKGLEVSKKGLVNVQRVICFHLKILFTLHKLQVCGGNSHLKCSIRCGIISHILLTLLKYHMDIYQTLFTYFQTFL